VLLVEDAARSGRAAADPGLIAGRIARQTGVGALAPPALTWGGRSRARRWHARPDRLE